MIQNTRIMPFWVMAIMTISAAFPVSKAEAAIVKKKRAVSASLKKKSKKISALLRARKKHVRVAEEANDMRMGQARVSKDRLIEAKHQALELIRTSSEEVSKLAGLEPGLTAVSNEEPTPQAAMLGFADQPIMDGEDASEVEREDDVTVDIDRYKMMWLSYVDGDSEDAVTSSGVEKQQIMNQIMDWLGTQYVFGGTGRTGIDCSAFMQTIFGQVNINLPRTAAMQYEIGMPVERENLEFGDVIFFHTRKNVYVSHVGVYLGDNLFAHASSRYGVTVSSLESTFYNERFIGARRMSPNNDTHYTVAADGKITYQN